MSTTLHRLAGRSPEHFPAIAGVVGPAGFGPRYHPRAVRGLVIAAANVLYDDTLWRRWVLHLLIRCGLQTHYQSLFRVWEREFEGDVCRGQRPFCEAFRAFLRSLGLSRGLSDELTAACRTRRDSCQASARPLTGVRQALARLREAGTVLGTIGNTGQSTAALRGWLRRFDIETPWSAVIASVDIGCAMPEAAYYRAALEAIGLPATEVAFVGHGTAELAGAAEVGMLTIAVNCDPDATADVYLERFGQLIETVAVPRPLAAAG